MLFLNGTRTRILRLMNLGVLNATMLFTLSNAYAAVFMSYQGEIHTISDNATVRERYPDGRIVDVVGANALMTVDSVSGDGRGMWAHVTYKRDNKVIKGYIDVNSTSFGDDVKTGHVK